MLSESSSIKTRMYPNYPALPPEKAVFLWTKEKSAGKIRRVKEREKDHLRGFPASLRVLRQRPSLLRLRTCPAVGPVLTSGPWVWLGLDIDALLLSIFGLSGDTGIAARFMPAAALVAAAVLVGG